MCRPYITGKIYWRAFQIYITCKILLIDEGDMSAESQMLGTERNLGISARAPGVAQNLTTCVVNAPSL